MYDFSAPVVTPPKKRFNWRRPRVLITTILLVIALLGMGGVAYMNYWYHQNLKPLSSKEMQVRVTIEQGLDASAIGKLLEEKKLIRSAYAFSRYVDKSHNRQRLQAGTYLLSPSYSIQQIVELLVGGKVDAYELTITPGRRLDHIKASLIKAGFDKAQVEAALAKKYSHPLLADKPAARDLEGYVFPDTYQLDSQTTPEKLLLTTFDVFYKNIQEEGLIEPLRQKGLNLYQAITLASIVQQEVTSYEDQQKVAQVFLKRLKENISLGADPTFRYASYKAGVPDNITIDSPYNTRIHKGLPPGPIGNFNMSALKAVAHPSATDYLYFVAGDDGITRFSKTLQEHEKLQAQYCIDLCKQ